MKDTDNARIDGLEKLQDERAKQVEKMLNDFREDNKELRENIKEFSRDLNRADERNEQRIIRVHDVVKQVNDTVSSFKKEVDSNISQKIKDSMDIAIGKFSKKIFAALAIPMIISMLNFIPFIQRLSNGKTNSENNKQTVKEYNCEDTESRRIFEKVRQPDIQFCNIQERSREDLSVRNRLFEVWRCRQNEVSSWRGQSIWKDL